MEPQATASSAIISYLELSMRERQQLQKGMNYRKDGRLSVFLMSSRHNAPYKDKWDSEKQVLIYEGHDDTGDTDKKLDQPMHRATTGRLSDNGKFYAEAMSYKEGKRASPFQIQVYEKLDVGVWFDKGVFDLVDAEWEQEPQRKVFKFYLHPTDKVRSLIDDVQEYKHERMIPTSVKVEVWKRDKGQCTTCGATTGLHYDHILPFSRGGRSDDARNIQILCARHNLQKSDKIQ
jgi:hypothetical protein